MSDVLKARIQHRIDAFLDAMVKEFPGSEFYVMGIAMVDGKFVGGAGSGTLAPWHILPHLGRTWEQMIQSQGANLYTRHIDTEET